MAAKQNSRPSYYSAACLIVDPSDPEDERPTEDGSSMRIRIQSATVSNGLGQMLGPLTLELYPGLIGLIGPNGSGKSRLIQLLAHVVPISSGSIEYAIDGIPLSPFQARKESGYVPQAIAIYEQFTVREYLAYVAGLKFLGSSEVDKTVAELGGFLEIAPLLDQRMGELSVGQQRLAMIAQSLIGSPKFLFLDEPFNNLDIRQRDRLLELLFVVSRRAIVLVSNHIVEEMGEYNQTIAMRDGLIAGVSLYI